MHPILALRLRHFLDGIAESRARHLMGMLTEEVAKQIHRDALTHLAQHPAHSLVHEVVGMMKVELGIAQAPRRVALLRGLPGADDAHALFPETGAPGEVIDDLDLIVFIAQSGGQQEPLAKDLMDGEIDQIPIVGLLGIAQIHRQDLIATTNSRLIVYQPFRGQPFELRHEYQQSAEPDLMPTVHQQLRDLAQREVFRDGTHHLARLGHFQSEERIALTILARSGLEEPHEDLALLVVLQRLHIHYYIPCCHHFDGKDTKKIEKYKRNGS